MIRPSSLLAKNKSHEGDKKASVRRLALKGDQTQRHNMALGGQNARDLLRESQPDLCLLFRHPTADSSRWFFLFTRVCPWRIWSLRTQRLRPPPGIREKLAQRWELKLALAEDLKRIRLVLSRSHLNLIVSLISHWKLSKRAPFSRLKL